jgi:histidyl-tRNA synthetase
MTNKIYKPRPISGFPEWLPDVRMIEQQWFDHIRRIFESYGFCNIETPSVEEIDVLHAKGEDVDKEIYVLERLHKTEGDKDARLALHFDQTVPLARYVAQHFGDLVFPFKRYQMQRVWRGERPQAGRFREFYQCDIDVINVDHLPLHFDAEMPAIMWEVMSSLPGMENENIQIRVSNRKILMGLLDALGIEQKIEVTRIIDKLEKIGQLAAEEQLMELGVTLVQLRHIRALIAIKTETPTLIFDYVKSIDVSEVDTGGYKTLCDGAQELATVLDNLSHLPEGAIVADLSIVRGLDYYTGTVYETVFIDDPGYGSICSGGRYDDLASSYINKRLPGVGISIGFSRLFGRLHREGKLPKGRLSPADVFVVLPSQDHKEKQNKTARILRERGFNVETAHGGKLKKQLAYAEKKDIPYVWFPDEEASVKNMATGEQAKADLETYKFA